MPKKWMHFRDHFLKELCSVKKRLSGDAGPPIISNWPLFDIHVLLCHPEDMHSTNT